MNIREVDFTPPPEEYTVAITPAELAAYRDPDDPTSYIRDITEYISDVVGPMFLGVEDAKGDELPWGKAADLGFRPAETTVWAGINGHGKSALVTQVALWWALKGRRSLIASFEMLPKATIKRMLLQAAGNPSPTEEMARRFFVNTKGKVFIYDRRDRIHPEDMMAVVRYAAKKLKIQHVWIDSLQKVVRGDDDYNGQKALVEDLTNMARELGIHIHIIAHVRKQNDETTLPNKFDAKGSSAISDLVDNYITVWRNKRKERDREKGDVDEGLPDFMLIVDKNRHGGWEGKVPLWGDLGTWHFRGTAAQQWTRGYDLDKRDLAA